MKAMSIIGLVMSVIGLILGIGMFSNSSGIGLVGILIVMIMLYFLAFSITATTSSFKKKPEK